MTVICIAMVPGGDEFFGGGSFVAVDGGPR